MRNHHKRDYRKCIWRHTSWPFGTRRADSCAHPMVCARPCDKKLCPASKDFSRKGKK